jgi:AcrR family transcriptional regulator
VKDREFVKRSLGNVTKGRILDAAEQLFGERGLSATSLRAITSAAGVNQAAINYRFRCKNGLVRAVYARRLGPVNERRLEMLDACEARHSSDGLPLEEVVEAFVAPIVQLGPEGGFRPLMGRMYTEPGDFLRNVILEHMAEVARRFKMAFGKALPELPERNLYWGAFFTIGMLAHTMHGTKLLDAISAGLCNPGDREGITHRMVVFASAGIRSLVP